MPFRRVDRRDGEVDDAVDRFTLAADLRQIRPDLRRHSLPLCGHGKDHRVVCGERREQPRQGDLRDGGYALGADKLQVSTRIVVPAAISGIVAAFVLGFSRAVGETMIVLIAGGQLAQLSLDPRLPIETMTAFIGATGNGDVPTGSIEYKTIFAVGLTLFVMTLFLNLLSIRMVRKFREVYE